MLFSYSENISEKRENKLQHAVLRTLQKTITIVAIYIVWKLNRKSCRCCR